MSGAALRMHSLTTLFGTTVGALVDRFRSPLATPMPVQLNGGRDTLYFINNDIWRMPVVADHVPVRPFLKYKQAKFYGLSIDPNTSEVYVADAIDYQQKGIVYRYSPEGELLDEFRVGIIPGAFCWY